ncbi:unnamed protein product [Calypogeia fissa]
MPSHCRSAGLGPGLLNLHAVHPSAFPLAKGPTMQHNIFDVHRTYQVDSCTSTFHPVKEDPSPTVSPSSSLQLHPPNCSRAGLNPAVEEVDVETILQLGELQDWAWPASVAEAQEVKPATISSISELSLPFSAQSMQLSSTIIHPSNIHDDPKGSSTSSLFGPRVVEMSHGQQHQQQSFDLQSWCSGVRSIQSPYVSIPKLLPASNGGFQTSAEPSPTTDTSPLRLDTRDLKCSPVTTPLSQARYPTNLELQPAEKFLGVQKTWQGKRAVTQRESHIWSERQRRKGMNHLFSTLRSLLPQPTSKTDKSTVVSEIIKYIQGLQLKLDELNKRRADILRRKPIDMTVSRVGSGPNLQHISSNLAVDGMAASVSNESSLQSFVMPNVALHISGSNAFITMSSMKKKGIFSRILLIMQSHKLDVINAHISTSSGTVFHCLHVLAPQQGGDFPKETLQTALQTLTLPESSL